MKTAILWRKWLRWAVPLLLLGVLYWIAAPGRKIFPHPPDLHSGDIVFVRGNSLRGAAVRLLEVTSNDYSHVGIVVIDGGLPFVIHADPARGSANNRVIKEPWDALISPQRISAAAIFRLADQTRPDIPVSASATARRFLEQALPFDHDFDLRTADKLYCTELVWRAYFTAGIDLRGKLFSTSRKYLLPSDLIESGLIREVTRL